MSEKIDKLARGEFIEFIKGLIINSEQYKRNNESDSYVIALDSAWGTGKSYFIDLLTQSATDDTLKIVKYNAWKNDYCENAFEPLIYDVLTSECLRFPMENETDAENVQKMISYIGKIGLAMGKQLLFSAAKDKFGIDVKEAFAEVKDSNNPFKEFIIRQSKELSEINSERESFERFKQYLEGSTVYLKSNNQKLVVIIDELDRCKPTFAIQTLEVVKHLFDIENIVFLFAVDIQQLSHSISSVYGQGFDSVGYLCRFFDYIAKMPEADIKHYILDFLLNIEALKDMIDVSIYNPNFQKSFYEILKEFFNDIYSAFNFSLRDLDTVIKSYKIMVNNFLFNYNDVEAHMIYIFFLSLKYKYPTLFLSLFASAPSKEMPFDNNTYKMLQDYFYENPNIISAIEWLDKNDKLSNCFFNNSNNQGNSFKIINSNKKDTITIAFSSKDAFSENYHLKNISEGIIGNILFAPELIKWDNIKHMTYREYLHKQLEMYNFFNVETDND